MLSFLSDIFLIIFTFNHFTSSFSAPHCPQMADNVVAAWRSGGLPTLATSHVTCCLVVLSDEPHPPLRQTAR